MNLSQMVMLAIQEAERPRLSRSAAARAVRAGQRRKLKTTLVTKTVNDLMKVVNNRKSLLGSEMGDMRVFKVTKYSPNPAGKQFVVHGESRGTKLYKTSISFYKVDFSDEKDKEHPLTVNFPYGVKGYMKQLRSNFNPIQTTCTCFTGDTLIPLLDGKSVPIKDLVGKDEFFVYSYDLNKSSIEVGRGFNCRKTGKNVSIVEVIFDNGNKIRCTSDHKFLMKDGLYKEVKDIEKGESLRALHRRLSSGKNCERLDYELVHQGKSWEATHWASDRYNVKQGIETLDDVKIARHHKDFNKRNNRPDNIERIDFAKHIGNHQELARNLSLKKVKDGSHPFLRKSMIDATKKRMVSANPMKDKNIVKKVKETNIKNGAYKRTSDRMLKNNPMKSKKVAERMVATNKKRGNFIGAGYHFRAKDLDVRKKMSKTRKKLIKEGVIDIDFIINRVHKANRKLIQEGKHNFQSKEHKEKTSQKQLELAEQGKHSFQNPSKESIEKRVESYKKSTKVNSWLKSLTSGSFVLTKDIANNLGYTSEEFLFKVIENKIKQKSLDYLYIENKEGKIILYNYGKAMNHKIISIKEIGKEDVYCMEVDKYHNFAIDVDNGKDLSSGVFVHNCLDFYHRWNWSSAKHRALLGKKHKPYQRKTPPPPEGYPFMNPRNLPGYCKHVLQSLNRLKKDRILI
jgi:hypothetical protein